MTFHHLNRFKAHNTAELAPNERLLAWHFTYETRAKTGIYSQSLRRLQEELELDPKTIRRAMARLVDLGLFERIDRTGVYAPIYRFILACPPSCDNLEDHNTKRELEDLKTLPLPNTPTLTGNQTPPYIEKREEEEKTFFEQIGSNELGWIIQSLEKLSSLTEPQKQLKELAELHPKTLAKVALELTAKLDTNKRKKAYLDKVATQDPKTLINLVEDQLGGLEGARRLQEAKPELPAITDLKPEVTSERVLAYATEILPNWKPSGLVRSFLIYKAAEHELTEFDVELAWKFEEMLKGKALPSLIERVSDIDQAASYFHLTWNRETASAVLRGDVTNVLDDKKIGYLYTAEELEKEVKRRNDLNELQDTWDKEHPEEAGSRNKFFMDTNTRAFFQMNPELLTEQQKSDRFISFWNITLDLLAQIDKDTLEDLNKKPENTFSKWLETNASLEEDFEKFLANFPEREKNSHQKNKKKAYPFWLKARKYFENSELCFKAGAYWDRLSNSEFSQLPQNWLSDLINEYENQKAVF